MKDLIIVGNGFDLAHNLKTSYQNFILDLKQSNTYYRGIEIRPNRLFSSLFTMTNELWSDIELTYFDILQNFNDKKYIGDKYREVAHYKSIIEFNKDFETLKLCLVEYLKYEQNQFKKNENYTQFFNHFNDRETLVLNFNYTNTVQNYIKGLYIEEIQIHGNLTNNENPMIFGYAASEEESKTLLIKNDNNYISNIKKFNYLYTNNVDLVKGQLEDEPFNIFILGHSCGQSDKLILNQILNSINVLKIIPFYYLSKESYFNIMVNIDRVIDDYSKNGDENKAFSKLVSYPKSYKMPQIDKDIHLQQFLTENTNGLNGQERKEKNRLKEKKNNEREKRNRDILSFLP